MFSLKLPAVLCALLILTACSGKGMDHVISLKEIDKLDEIANQMNPEEGEVFRQTVVAEVGKLTLQLGLSAITEGFAANADPSRDSATPSMDDALAKLQAFDGKTARSATIEILNSHKTVLQAKKDGAARVASARQELAKQVAAVKFDVQSVDVSQRSDFGRATDYLSVRASVSAPDAPEVSISGMRIHILGDDGKELRPPILAKADLRLPCSSCEVYLTSSADPVAGYGDIPKDPSAVTVEAIEWSAPNEPSGNNADAADLDNRLATLDRKIALVSKRK